MSALSQLTTSRPLPLSFDPSFMNVLNIMKKIINIFSDFYFSSYREKIIVRTIRILPVNLATFEPFFLRIFSNLFGDITQKIKSEKSEI